MNFHSICMFRFLPTSYLSSLFFFCFSHSQRKTSLFTGWRAYQATKQKN